VERAPEAVAHRLRYVTLDGAAHEIVVPQVEVDGRAPLVLGPPLRGGPWVAVHAPAMARGHRRVLYATRGRVRLPGRFAVDWFKVDETGATTGGKGDTPADWLGHGAEVLAVAEGIVAALRDDVAEPARFGGTPPIAIGDATGNFIALDVGDGRHVFYEHLARGLAVRRGERVGRGHVLGRVGASGQATGAHLHLHVADGPSPLDAEGLPFVLDGAERLGAYPTIEAVFRGVPWQHGAGADVRPAFPPPNTVLRFP
jgi:murein DD-endopeptidase